MAFAPFFRWLQETVIPRNPDNLDFLEIETTAIAHVACAPRESGILLTDFAAACPSVNHSWIFHVFRKNRCLSSSAVLYAEFTTTAPRTWKLQELLEFLMARSGRQGCPAFAMAFDFFFRWLPDAIIPRNLAGLEFLQPAQCAYADDIAVAALSFRDLITGLAPAFHSVAHTAGLNLNYRK